MTTGLTGPGWTDGLAALGFASLGIASLRSRYRSGTVSPLEVVEAVLARVVTRGQDGVWISRVRDEQVLGRARSLDPEQIDRLPLFGVPFAIKDNIDVAGMLTTVACPEFAYQSETSAVLVTALVDAGAILIGKTNLDQFATGLNGTRSPYGVPESVFGEGLISGGSSSGSAVAVAAGLVSFAIGTDTAGSGRVPAALNNIVGIKPSIGLVSSVGMVPACASLDCPSVFSLTTTDGAAVLAAMAGMDPVPTPRVLSGARFAVPARIPHWGERGELEAWRDLCSGLQDAGAELVPIDLEDFFEAGRQLYGGAWIAERYQVMAELLAEDPEAVLPVLRTLMAPALGITGVETFAAVTAMAAQRNQAHATLDEFDALVTPTCTTTFTVAEVHADPIATNERLGTFTTFTNLLDLCAIAVPAGLTSVGLPFGVTLQAAAGRDALLQGWAVAIEGLR